MSITQYKIKRSDGNYYDISGVFSTKTSSAITVASSNPYKYSTTTNILNNFEVYSSTGSGHPLQTKETGYKINNVDISKYYTPYYSFISGFIIPTSIPIPNWASKVSFIIQAAGGSKGSNSTGSRTQLYDPVTKRANFSNSAYFRNGNQIYPTANQSFTTYYSNYPSMSINVYKGKLYQKGTTYTGGNGSGGTCYLGTYSINDTPRSSGMTYTSNGSTSYLQFNDISNSSVTVPNGTTGGNATSSQNGTNGGQSSDATIVNSGKFSGKSYPGISYSTSTDNSGYSTIPLTEKNSYPLPTSASTSFTVQGKSAQPAFFIYWFLI